MNREEILKKIAEMIPEQPEEREYDKDIIVCLSEKKEPLVKFSHKLLHNRRSIGGSSSCQHSKQDIGTWQKMDFPQIHNKEQEI